MLQPVRQIADIVLMEINSPGIIQAMITVLRKVKLERG